MANSEDLTRLRAHPFAAADAASTHVAGLRAWPLRLAAARTLFLPCLLVTCAALDLVWLLRFRWGYPTEWDESGYIAIAVRDTDAFRSSGPVEYLRTVVGQGVEAPLMPAVTLPFHLALGTGVNASLLVPLVFFLVLVAATYGLARRVLEAGWAEVATLTVAAAPVVTDYTRLYHFSVPAAAMFTAALWALVASDGLRERRLALLAGASLGLALLARTMTVAYVPGIALAATGYAAASVGERPRRLANLGLAGIACLVVAASWYFHNWRGVYHYLVGSGYGPDSNLYGQRRPVLSTGFWTREVHTLSQELYLPLATLLALALLVGGLAALARRSRWRSGIRTWPAQGWFVLAVVVLEGYLALSTSRNVGTAFALPWIPALIVLAVASASKIPSASLRTAAAAVFVAVGLLNLLMKAGFVPLVSSTRTVSVAGVGAVPVIDGRGIIQWQVANSGYRVSATEPLPSFQRRWLAFERRAVRWIAAQAPAEAHGYLAANHLLLTNTALRLAAALERKPVHVGWLKPYEDTVAADRSLLRGVQFLLVAENPSWPGPRVTLAKAEQAARSLGFRVAKSLTLPDGHQARIWWHRGQ